MHKIKFRSVIFIVLMFLSVEAKSDAGFKDQCKSCHGQLFEKWDEAKAIHYPYKEGECLSCHAQEHKKFNQPTKKELCLSCHTDLIKQDDKVIHPGFELQDCTGCHNPHASDFDKQLNKKQSELCFGCHDKSVAEKHPYGVKPSDKVTVNEDKKWLTYEGEVTCTSCHNPHAAVREFLLREPVAEGGLCYNCHKK